MKTKHHTKKNYYYYYSLFPNELFDVCFFTLYFPFIFFVYEFFFLITFRICHTLRRLFFIFFLFLLVLLFVSNYHLTCMNSKLVNKFYKIVSFANIVWTIYSNQLKLVSGRFPLKKNSQST